MGQKWENHYSMSENNLPINEKIRMLKIALITGIPNEISDWFKWFCKDLLMVETEVYHRNGGEFLFYKKGDKNWVFFSDGERFWCNYQYYWMHLEYKFLFGYIEIECVSKLLIENLLGKDIGNPRSITTFDITTNEYLNGIILNQKCIPVSVYPEKI